MENLNFTGCFCVVISPIIDDGKWMEMVDIYKADGQESESIG